MMRVEVVGYITLFPRSCFIGLELRLGLAHVTIEIAKIAQSFCSVSRVCVRRIEALVVFHEDKHSMLARLGQ